MMKFNIKTQISFIAALVVAVLIMGCTNDFEEINTNPNAPVSVQPSGLFRKVLYDYGEQMSYEGFVAGGLLSQHFTALDFNFFDRHALKSPQLGGNPWPTIYENLRDNEVLITDAKSIESAKVYLGPALIYKAYLTMALTDLYGDVPYFEAFKGKEGSTTPKYDTQREIYLSDNGILNNLELGIEAMNSLNTSLSLEGDILFAGDLDQWIKMANSLKIKALIRISGKENVAAQLQSIVDEGNYLNNGDLDAVFTFNDSPPNNFRMSRLRIGDFNNFVASKTLTDILLENKDPRIEKLLRPRTNQDEIVYQGLINGIDAANFKAPLAEYSQASTLFRESSAGLKINYMTVFETKFLLAEAALKGLISLDAKTLYEEGVSEAFKYWGVEMPTDYLTNEIPFETANGLNQIITQKWIANVINGYEGWIENRRTGFPVFNQVQASLNNDLLPVRMPYPAEEETLNGKNYQEIAKQTDNNSINFKVWWNQ